MRRLIIAIDCDDVLIHASEYVVTTYNQRYGTNVRHEHAHTSGNIAWEADREEVFKRLNKIQNSEEFGRIDPSPEGVEVVHRLSQHHELHLVTARPADVMQATERMLDRYFPKYFTSVHHVGPDQSKGEVCDSLRADVIIDDNLKHLVTAMECGVPYRLWFGDYLWQQEEEDSAAYTGRVRDWYEVEAEIGRIAN